MAALKQHLSNIAVSQIPLPQDDVLVLKSTDTVDEAFEKLRQSHILSAPVYDDEAAKFVGMLDAVDLLTWVVFVYNEKKGRRNSSLHEKIVKGMRFSREKVKTLTDLSDRNPFTPITPETSILEAVNLLSSGIHRLPVIDRAGKCINIISQSSIVNILVSAGADVLGDLANVQTSQFAKMNVTSVSGNESTISALESMLGSGVSALPVLDQSGLLLETLSVTDLARVLVSVPMTSFAQQLDVPVREFLQQRTGPEHIEAARAPAMGVSATDSFGLYLGKVAATHVHRMWVVDNHQHVQGVASLLDALSFVNQQLS
eukprot:GFYU01012692.1.p1 GENE.GFYU01012692.1~~GFYU01012692.1.p1  ORF type:complete len:333 (+),score=90.96 GFYU01012692.1:56-1000(+)